MKAEQAYELASTNANIDSVLGQIETEATKGNYSISVSKLSDAQQAKLTALGYLVSADWSALGAISGRTRDRDCTQHTISWYNVTLSGIDSLKGLMK